MSFIRCEFKGNRLVILRLEKSQYEPEIIEETLRNFKSRDNHNRIEIIQTKIHVSFMHIYINNAARCLKVENVDLNSDLDIYFGGQLHDFQTVSVFELEMINCRVFAFIGLDLGFPNSFAKLRFESIVFKKAQFSSVQHVGLGSYVFENCTFIEVLTADFQNFWILKYFNLL